MSSRKEIDHSGSTFDSFLADEGLLEQAEAVAVKRVLACTQVDRLLNPSYVSVSLETVAKAARAVGKRVRVEIVDAAPSKVRAARQRTRHPAVRSTKIGQKHVPNARAS